MNALQKSFLCYFDQFLAFASENHGFESPPSDGGYMTAQLVYEQS